MRPELFLGAKGISGSQYLGQGMDTLLSLLKEYEKIILNRDVEEGYRPKYPTLEYIVLTELYDDLLEEHNILKADIRKLARVKEDTPIEDIFSEVEKFMPVSAEYGYEPKDYPKDFWAEVSRDTKATFYGMLHIVPPEFGEILQHYIQVIDSIKEQQAEETMRQLIHTIRGLSLSRGDMYNKVAGDIIDKLMQKQHIIDIMKADEKDGLYVTCICGQKMTLVRPGKYQCDHCGN